MDESEIWKNFKKGSEQDFTSLYRKYAPVMFRYGCKLSDDRDLIKDCLQRVFFNLWKSRENISNPPSVKNYLFKALRHEVLKSFGSKHLHDILPEDYNYHVEGSYESYLIEVQTAENTKKKISGSLVKLPPRQREVIFLRYYSNLSYEEISDIMGIEQKSVYKLTYKAIEKLQQLFILK